MRSQALPLELSVIVPSASAGSLEAVPGPGALLQVSRLNGCSEPLSCLRLSAGTSLFPLSDRLGSAFWTGLGGRLSPCLLENLTYPASGTRLVSTSHP